MGPNWSLMRQKQFVTLAIGLYISMYLKSNSVCAFVGEDREILSGDLLLWGDIENCRPRLLISKECLSTQRMEHYGLCGGCHRVSTCISACIKLWSCYNKRILLCWCSYLGGLKPYQRPTTEDRATSYNIVFLFYLVVVSIQLWQHNVGFDVNIHTYW